ncbi:MAG: hemolysin family protein [Candidatus Kapabacteria bacterium]|nr:hemolysin family protein [Candidatus Kapabacteria bacterium]
MDDFSVLFQVIPILILISGWLSAADVSFSKYKSYFDEDKILQSNFYEKLAYSISDNYHKYETTFNLSRIIVGILLIIYLNEFILVLTQSQIVYALPEIFDFLNNNNKSLAYLIILLLIFPVIFLFVDVIPKMLSGKPVRRISVFSALPIFILHLLITPLRLFYTIPEKTLDLIFKNKMDASNFSSEEEIREMIEESSKAGNIEENESKLIDNIFEFKDTVARQVMTPRKNIISIGEDWNENDILETITAEGYSRYPVFSETIDNIVGVLHTKDLVNLILSKKHIVPKDLMRSTVFVKEEDNIDEILKDFQKLKIQMAVVLDDFGGTSGIITMEDILEEIVGEIHDEHDEVNKILEYIEDGIFSADASAHIRDLNDLLPEPLPESDDYESLGGLLITETENIPELNTEIIIGHYKFLIIKRSKTKIEKVKIYYLPESKSEE